jgi:hypothetical protein
MSPTMDQDMDYTIKYVLDIIDPDATVEKMTTLCEVYQQPSIDIELFRFYRYTQIDTTGTLLYTIINTEEFQTWLKMHLSDYFTLLPYDFDYIVGGSEEDIIRDDILVCGRFSLPTHYHNGEPCWEEERDCIPCHRCGGRMEPGVYSGLGCSRSCAYSR